MASLLPGFGFIGTGVGASDFLPGIGFAEMSTGGPALATTLLLSGPDNVMQGYTSAQFAITLNGALSGSKTVTITADDGSTFAPAAPVLTPAQPGANFTMTPATPGTRTITITAPGLATATMQVTAAAYVAPPAVSITQVAVDGDEVTLSLALGDHTDSGVATLTAVSGGVSKPAQPITINNTTDTGTVTFVDCEPGTYSGAVSVSNVIGTANTATPANIVIGEISGEIGEGDQTPVPDTTAPTAPGVPAISSITQTTAVATWAAATDAVGVAAYEWRLDGGGWNNAGTALTTALTTLTAATGYTFEVRARDAAGNTSAPSSASFTTAASGGGGAAPKEILSVNPVAHTLNDTYNLIVPGKWAEAVFEFGPNPEVNLNDFLTFYSVDQLQGLRVADWYVKSEQLDMGSTPALAVDIGFGGVGGVSGTAGYRFASARALGHAATGSCIRDDNFGCHRQNAPSLRLGLSIASLPEVAAFANKRITFGILPMAVLYSK